MLNFLVHFRSLEVLGSPSSLHARCPVALGHTIALGWPHRRENRDDSEEDREKEEAQQASEKQEAKKATLQRTKAKKPRLIF